MFSPLLRRLGLLPRLVLLLLGLAAARPALATHLLGGEMTYKYLDATGPTTAPNRYEVTVVIYNNCPSGGTTGIATPSPTAFVTFYDQATGARLNLTTTNYSNVSGGLANIPESYNSGCIQLTPPVGCPIANANQPYILQRFIGIINLPTTVQGFYATWSVGSRNGNILNLSNSGGQNMMLYNTLSPPSLPNSSPYFTNNAVALICYGDTTTLLNNAADPDGDRLVYSFGQAYNASPGATFFPPPSTIPYIAPYTPTNPLGTAPGNFAILDPNTGITKFGSTAPVGSKFVVAVDVSEYRTINNRQVLIGVTRRDLQLVVGTCPPAATPVLPPTTGTGTGGRNYTIEAGSTLTIPLTATQSDGHPLTMTLNSVLLDGAGGYDATFAGNPGTLTPPNPAGTANVSGATGNVSGTFVFTAACNAARTQPYDISLLVQDNGCAGKTVADIIHITVTKPTGRTAVVGDLTVCGIPSQHTYTASGGTAPQTSWRVVGGTIVGSPTANPVTVNWTTAGTGTLWARGVSQYGCLTDSASIQVNVGQAPTLNVTGNTTICPGSSTTLSIASGAATYTVTGGGSTITGPGPFTLSPAATTVYTITAVTAGTACGATSQVTVTVSPLPAANAGAATTICAGGSTQLGAAAVAGNTYSWSPATGLSSATVANPTVTLTNSTGAPITQTYTLTETNPTTGCQASNSVTITVSPPLAVAAGSNTTICSGASTQIGAAAVTGLTYSWSPATGLSSATVANPTVTLTNTTNAPITQTYTVTATDVAGCVGTGTVTLTVNPLPVATPGAAVAFCSGTSGQLGAAAVAGLTYSWSPATGLSSTTAANPTVTLTNTTSTPITQTYTLTVTDAVGCTGTGTVVVTVNPLPVATPGAAVAFCSGGSGQLGATAVAGLTYSWSPATGLSSATVANPTVTLTNTTNAATTQTYTLTVTGAGNCTSTGTVVVTVNPLPVATPGAAVAFCSGGSGQLGATAVAGLTYSWSPATGLSSTTVANPTVTLTNTTNAATTQTYTLTVTNPATGCTNTGTVVVTVNPLPVAAPGAAVAICSGAPGQLGATAVAGNTYSWSPATGLSSTTAANPTVTLTNTTNAATTQTYTLTVTSAAGCVSTGTVVVTVNPLPTVVPGAAIAFCSGGSGQLGAPAAAGLTYSWSPATGLSDPTVANPTVTLTNTTTAATTQTYTLTVTNTATNCTNTGTVVVTVNPLPVVTAGAAVAICSGASGQLGAAAVVGNTYSWSPATGLSSTTAANPTVTLTNTTGAPVTQTYTLTVTNATGCVNTGTVVVTVNPLPVASAGAAVTICSTSSAQLGAAAVAGNTYSWSPATGLSDPTVANPTVTLTNTTSASTTQTYTLTVTSAAGCTSTATVAVTVTPLPVAVAGTPVTICSGNTTQLGATPVAGLTYSWSPATGLSNTVIANPTLTLTNVSPTGTAISPTYTLTVTNPATGCTNTSTVVVTVNAEILPGIIGPNQTVCASATPVPLTSTPGPSGGYGTYTYQWEVSTDNLTWTAVPNATTDTYAPGPLATTLYYRRRVNSGSCAEQVSNSVKLELQPLLTTAVTLATPATQCAGTSLTFTPVPTNAGPAPTFRWYVNNTLVATSPTYTSSTLNNGDVVRVEVVPTAGFCATTLAVASVTVNLTPVTLPTVLIKPLTTLPACSSTAVDFAVDSIGSPGTTLQYQWQVDGVSIAGATSPTFTSSTLRDGQVVTLVVTTPSACGTLTATSNPLAVTIIQNVDVDAGPNKTIMEGESVELEGTANGTYPVIWTPMQTLTFPGGNQLRPMASPTVTTTYTLSAKVGDCSDESQVTITVTPRVRIPNAFSPNGDGLDDTWEIDRIAEYPNSHVVVFNRWGNKLFETTNYGRGNEWNGTINGQPAPLGTYYYLITLGNGKSYSGPLTVVY